MVKVTLGKESMRLSQFNLQIDHAMRKLIKATGYGRLRDAPYDVCLEGVRGCAAIFISYTHGIPIEKVPTGLVKRVAWSISDSYVESKKSIESDESYSVNGLSGSYAGLCNAIKVRIRKAE